ncbi:endothelial differentiation-related factor 1-like [Oopsacas minuta]|uniref:Endothelial differentiation-related factor 1-like n=1 Tax=Oopsacas minuta TaxID=111878 RepID=A0AAV7K550_9METZ|nr:endothelial differentiation-related factor 1-like [Oopsacas minuta]
MAGINIDVNAPTIPMKNPISFLQELSQMHRFPMPEYEESQGNYNEFGYTVKINFSHDPAKVFNFYGNGKTKKNAKTRSAETAIEYLRRNLPQVFEAPPPPEVIVDLNELSPMVRDMHLKKMPQMSSNKQTFSAKSESQLVHESEELGHQKLGIDVGKLIQRGRMDKGLTQKDLAGKINEKPNIIVDYELGKVVPNIHIMSKLERALGMKLRGPSAGQPFGSKK